MNTKAVPLELYLSQQLSVNTYDFFCTKIVNTIDEEFKDHYKAMVQKEFIKKDNNGYMFSVKILNRKQSRTEELEALEEVLDFLQEKVVLYTDTNGDIISIINRAQIRADWEDKIFAFKKNNKEQIPNIEEIIHGITELISDPGAFLNFIKKSEIFSLLFPPVFNIDLLKIKSVSQKKKLHNFFKHVDLPIQLETQIVALNVLTNGLQIKRNGKLDNYVLMEDELAKFFMDTYGIHKSNLSYNVNLLEYYDLDRYNNIDKANGLLNVEVPNVFSYKQINRLIQKK